jgi:hypothetical protein
MGMSMDTWTFSLDMKHGHASWTFTIGMLNGHVPRTVMMDKLHDKHRGHEAWTCSMDKHH